MSDVGHNIYLWIERNGMPIPYSRVPEQGHDFIDLKVEPQRIDELPELERFPEFRPWLVALNQSETPFRTIGMEAAVNPPSNGYVLTRGYLNFAIVPWEFATPEIYFKVFMGVNSILPSGSPGGDPIVELALEQATLFPPFPSQKPVVGHWWVNSYAKEETESRKRWSDTFQLIVDRMLEFK